MKEKPIRANGENSRRALSCKTKHLHTAPSARRSKTKRQKKRRAVQSAPPILIEHRGRCRVTSYMSDDGRSLDTAEVFSREHSWFEVKVPGALPQIAAAIRSGRRVFAMLRDELSFDEGCWFRRAEIGVLMKVANAIRGESEAVKVRSASGKTFVFPLRVPLMLQVSRVLAREAETIRLRLADFFTGPCAGWAAELRQALAAAEIVHGNRSVRLDILGHPYSPAELEAIETWRALCLAEPDPKR